MSKPDAERALSIYKRFAKQTEDVVAFLGIARQYEASTRLQIPKLKHAPTGLTNSLQDYLNDPDFEVNRRQYLAQQEAKKSGRPVKAKPFETPAKNKEVDNSFPESKQIAQPKVEAKGPAPDLIDFFESIEQNQTTMGQPVQQQPQFNGYQQPPQQQYLQQTGFVPQNAPFQQAQQQQQQPGGNPFGQPNGNAFGQPQQQQQPPPPQALQPDFTGAGFGGYGPQPQQNFVPHQSNLPSISEGSNAFPQPAQQQPQQSQLFDFGQSQQQPFQVVQSPQQEQPQSTNPFRQSMMPQATGMTNSSSFSATPQQISPLQRQSTNPFARSITNSPSVQQQPPQFPPQAATNSTPFTSPPPQPQQQPLQNQATSPFTSPPPQQQQQQQQPLQPQRTGTNPFAKQPVASPPPPSTAPLRPNPTGSTNPFRQSQFINQQTGQGWQTGPQGTMGGLENLETMPVFPRPGQ